MNLVFDRTPQDVARWQELRKKGWVGMNEMERQEWLSGMKGAYGITDMNRVETAVKTLSARMRELGYLHPALITKTNWVTTDCPTVVDFGRYFGNVDTLRRAIPLPVATPRTPTTAAKLNHQLANDVEKILYDIHETTEVIPKAWHYAGELFMGEV